MKTALLRLAAVGAGALVLILSAAFSPIALRAFDGFSVRRVEVTGARHLTAEAAAAASGVTAVSNLFDDPNPWIDGLLAHPLVLDVRVQRRLPGTLVFHVREAVPIAFARTPELRAIDEHGRILPADLAHAEMDLPVLTLETKVSADGVAADDATRDVVAFLGDVARLEPGLLTWMSEAGLARDGSIRMTLRHAPAADVLISPHPTAERLHQLQLTLDEEASTAGLAGVQRIDARFDGQVVVARQTGKN